MAARLAPCGTVDIYKIGQAAKFMQERPAIADEISVTLARHNNAGSIGKGSPRMPRQRSVFDGEAH